MTQAKNRQKVLDDSDIVTIMKSTIISTFIATHRAPPKLKLNYREGLKMIYRKSVRSC